MAGKAEIGRYLPPKFDGNDPQQWLLNIQVYFNLYKVPEDERLDMMELNLEGGALEWFHWMKKKNLLYSWHDLLEKIRVCFGASAWEFKQYEMELSQLTQKRNVGVYEAEFEGVVNNIVVGTCESQLISLFVEGLNQNLKRQVEAANPKTLGEAFALATYYEETSKPDQIQGPPFGTLLPKKRLSKADLKEKRSKGLCYNCDKKFNPKQPCPCRDNSKAL